MTMSTHVVIEAQEKRAIEQKEKFDNTRVHRFMRAS